MNSCSFGVVAWPFLYCDINMFLYLTFTFLINVSKDGNA